MPSVYFADLPPATAGAIDDEFDGNSGGVPNDWIEVDHNGKLAVTEDEQDLRFIQGGQQRVHAGIVLGDGRDLRPDRVRGKLAARA